MNYAATYVQPRQISFGPVVVGNLIALVLGPLGFVLGIVGLLCGAFGVSAEGRGDFSRADSLRKSASATARVGTWGSLALFVLGAIAILVTFSAGR